MTDPSTDDNYEPSPYDFVADHVEMYLSSNGEEGSEFIGFPCIVLTTTGRRTGKTRRAPLIRIRDGDTYVVIASMGGQPTHPVWYLNLTADPGVVVQDMADTHRLRARTVDGDERDRLWKLATSVYPEYDEYQTRCDRQIPVVVLE